MPSPTISNDELAIISQIAETHLPVQARVLVYGSRAKGTARTFSDLDLLIEGVSLSWNELAQIQEAFVESDLPYRTDITTRERMSEDFYRLIESDLIELIGSNAPSQPDAQP